MAAFSKFRPGYDFSKVQNQYFGTRVEESIARGMTIICCDTEKNNEIVAVVVGQCVA